MPDLGGECPLTS